MSACVCYSSAPCWLPVSSASEILSLFESVPTRPLGLLALCTYVGLNIVRLSKTERDLDAISCLSLSSTFLL